MQAGLDVSGVEEWVARLAARHRGHNQVVLRTARVALFRALLRRRNLEPGGGVLHLLGIP